MTNVKIKPQTTVYVVTSSETGKKFGINTAHIPRNFQEMVYLPSLKAAFKMQNPAFCDDGFDLRFDRYDGFSGGLWLDESTPPGAGAISRFLNREVKRLDSEISAPERLRQAKERKTKEHENRLIRVWTNPDLIGVGKGLDTGMLSNEPFKLMTSPSDLIARLNAIRLDPKTSPSECSAIESARFVLANKLSGIRKIWLYNRLGIDQQHDEVMNDHV
ncbi:hypothetical protein [Shewanella algae]|uniref:hypothetical protein n=1 Tax=Shewanella algae TaxID=38313 RepID=UPI00313DD394